MNDDLQTLVEKSKPIFKKYGFRKVGLFGSRDRGDHRQDSDIDFVVSLKNSDGVLNRETARKELENIFGVTVDLVPDTMIIARMRPNIARELKIIYEG